MKSYFTALAFIAFSSITSTAMAENIISPQSTVGGGFSGPVSAINTVQSVLDVGIFSDDQPVALTGYITQALGGEMYQFQDETGTINVEIDAEDWQGQIVKPTTKVVIMGEIDKEFTHTTIDVSSIRIVQ